MGQHNTFGLEIYASNRQFYVGRGQSITFPVEDGEMQVLPQHDRGNCAGRDGICRPGGQ